MSLSAHAIDLIIARLTRRLAILNVSSSPSSISCLERTQLRQNPGPFEFARAYLHEEVFILIFFPEVKHVREDVKTHVDTYDS
jgi:hypothetical protein